MRLLPGLPTPAGLLRLPMSDRSATELVAAILSHSTQYYLAVLEADPPLALWAVCQAAARGTGPIASLGQLSQWLACRAVDVLRWPDTADAAPVGGHPLTEQWTDQVAKDLLRARLASLLAADCGAATAADAFMLGLLADAPRWVQLCLDGSARPLQVCQEVCDAVVPQWLGQTLTGQSAAAAAVRRAIDVAAGGSWPSISRAAADNCREDSLHAARRWAERLCGPGDYLHVLTGRLARLARLENDFQAVLEQEKLASLAEFAAGAGHEINNPLTVITGRAQMLLQSETHPQRRRDLALISAQAMRVYEMIADMRLFARPPKPQLERVDLASVVQRAVESVQEQARQQQTPIIAQLPNEPITLQADPTQLIVAVRALLQNSLEALGHEGRVEVGAAFVPAEASAAQAPSAGAAVSVDDCTCPSVQTEDPRCANGVLGQVEIIVADNGPGITPEERRHIFDPFFSARQAGRGLGMGLSKCWRIVTNHGGTIAVESQPGKGATFRIRLPVAK